MGQKALSISKQALTWAMTRKAHSFALCEISRSDQIAQFKAAEYFSDYGCRQDSVGSFRQLFLQMMLRL